MNRTILGCVVLVGLLLNKPSLAQEFRSVPNFIRPTTKARLLVLHTVQRDLDLTEEQKQAVQRIQQAQRPVMAADLEKRLAAYAKDGLTAPQLARLEEIYVQTRGAESLYDSTIATKLRLSDDQRIKLADAGKKYLDEFDAWRKALTTLKPPEPEDRKAVSAGLNVRRQAIMEQFDISALSILTPAQRDGLKKLRGKPLDFSGERNTGGGGQRPRFME